MGKHLRFRPSPSMAVALLALFIALSGTTYAATGGNFILGQANSATSQTSLTSSHTSSPTLNVVNTGGRPAARFQANGGTAPFTVSNSTKVANLNADKLDGKDAAQLVGARAYGQVLGTNNCTGTPAFCTIAKNKGIAYAVEIGEGRFCVGVTGINAAAADSLAVVTPVFRRRQVQVLGFNFNCVSSEFEVLTSSESPDGTDPLTSTDFNIVIP